MIRRQPVCAIIPNDAPKAIYREVYVSIPDLRDAVMPKRDIASDRWLFQYLTQTLDRRVLTMLRRGDDSALAHSYSLNLNISTLLSPEFQAFDQSLRPGTRGSIIIEVEKVDIFNDIGAYIFARDYVRERGYRICLDGVTALTLPFIDRDRLGIDLVKVFWSPDLGDPARPERAAEVKAAIERVGQVARDHRALRQRRRGALRSRERRASIPGPAYRSAACGRQSARRARNAGAASGGGWRCPLTLGLFRFYLPEHGRRLKDDA